MAAHMLPADEVTHQLALAMATSSHTPLLLLDGALKVIAISGSFCRAFTINSDASLGKPVFELGAGEWNVPQLKTLLSAIATGSAEVEAYDFDLNRSGKPVRHLLLNAHKLIYGDTRNIRLLVGVADVTEQREVEQKKDDLVREKAVLLQELQHRIANSLQIIASVLMQSARQVQSDETRDHLKQAHHRIVSVAAVQRHLTSFTGDQVTLRPYLIQLCESLGASMIQDHARLRLTVDVDDSVTSADASVSLGLIVTELVINALKHAFPENREGKIAVAYAAHGAGWTLSVIDNGVGIAQSDTPKAGLGTSIVEALARQLRAEVVIEDAAPGTSVSIVRSDAAAANLNVEPDARPV